MNRSYIILLFLTLSVALIMPATAQDTGYISPYSRYGFGTLNHRTTGFNSGMAGVGIGLQDGAEVNPINPASYAEIDSLSFIFDVGASVQFSSFKSGQSRVNATTATLDYITAGFRLAPHLGFSLGVMPLTQVGYNTVASKTIAESYNHTSDIIATRSYTGAGGLHELYAGIGWAPVKYLSLGVNLGYVWGNIDHSSSVVYNDASVNSSFRNYAADIRTYSVRAGLQTQIPTSRHSHLTLGANYGLGHNVKRDALMVVGADSIKEANAFQLPHTVGAGVAWQRDGKWRIAADYEYQRWADCKFPWLTQNGGNETYESISGCFRNSHRVAVGVEYKPYKKGANWREYISYRAGLAVTTPYVNMASSSSSALRKGPMSYLATVGVNLPVMNIFGGRSSVNVSAQYERIQPAFAGQIKENNLRLCIGINFNEQWFSKWKVN